MHQFIYTSNCLSQPQPTGNRATTTRPPPPKRQLQVASTIKISSRPSHSRKSSKTLPNDSSSTRFLPTRCQSTTTINSTLFKQTTSRLPVNESIFYTTLLISFILLLLLSFSSNHHHRVVAKPIPSPAPSPVPSVITAEIGEDGSRECYDRCDCGMKKIELRIKCFTECLAKCLL